jgi:hypothetical protein
MPPLNLSRGECELLDRALDAYMATDESPDVQALSAVRSKLADLWAAGRWQIGDAIATDDEPV